MALTCPSCGNDQNFLVKTLQMHVVQLRESRVEASEEGRPAVIEVLCDECETALNFSDFEEDVRNEVLSDPRRPLSRAASFRAPARRDSSLTFLDFPDPGS